MTKLFFVLLVSAAFFGLIKAEEEPAEVYCPPIPPPQEGYNISKVRRTNFDIFIPLKLENRTFIGIINTLDIFYSKLCFLHYQLMGTWYQVMVDPQPRKISKCVVQTFMRGEAGSIRITTMGQDSE